jgi:Zn ribbon nucleic-acid-binding protein
MGSIIDYIACPNCGQEAYNDYYYKTGEEYINCQKCGYHYSATYKTDDKGKFVTKDGTENYTLDNLIMEVNEIKFPYGAYRYTVKDQIGTACGSAETEEGWEDIKKAICEIEGVESLTLSRYINGEIKTEVIYDRKESRES